MVIKTDRRMNTLGNRPNVTFLKALLIRNGRSCQIFVLRKQLNHIVADLFNRDIRMTLRLQLDNDIILTVVDHGQRNHWMYTGYESCDYSLSKLWSIDFGNRNEKRFIEFLIKLLDGIRRVHARNIAFNNISLDTIMIRNDLGDLIPKIYDLSMTSEADNNLDRVRDLNTLGRLLVTLLMEEEAEQTLASITQRVFNDQISFLTAEISRKNAWISNANAACLSFMTISLIVAEDYNNDMINMILELPFEY